MQHAPCYTPPANWLLSKMTHGSFFNVRPFLAPRPPDSRDFVALLLACSMLHALERLHLIQFFIDAVIVTDKLLVRAALNYAPLLHNNNDICMLYG